MNGREKSAEISALLKTAEVIDPDYEAAEIIKEVCGGHPMVISSIDEAMSEKINHIVKKRIKGEPLQYIFGKWEFYGYEFFVEKGVLIPRPETELLIDIAKERLNKNSVVLDLCSGSGCIPAAINKEIGCKTYAVELYPEAFAYLTKNIRHNGADVTAVKGDALDNSHFKGVTFDAVFSNPPYLTAAEMEELQREVRHEPSTALFGGNDGLDFYRQLFSLWKPRLKKGGIFAVEVGDRQGEAVKALMEAENYTAEIINDYNGIGRVVLGVNQ